MAGRLLQSGRTFTVCGTGYRSGAGVSFTLHSSPVALGGLTATGAGLVSGSVSIPAGVPDGSHTVMATDGVQSQSASVTVKADITPPQLVAFSFTPTSVDTSTGGATITATAHITDDLSGNAGGSFSGSPSQVAFVGPNSQRAFAIFSDPQRISGNGLDGVYQSQISVPQWSAPGTWTAQSFLLVDNADNVQNLTTAQLTFAGFPTTFSQTGPGDTTAPQLAGFSFAPTSIDTSTDAATVSVTAHITDDLSGNGASGSPSQAAFVGPNAQRVTAIFSDSQRISGTKLDGVYQYSMTIPHWSAQGTWTAQSVLLADNAGNTQSMTTSQLQTAGFPTTFQETGPGDTTPPQLAGFSFTPTSVDTSSGSATITVTAHVTDDLSGNVGSGFSSSPSQVIFKGPNSQQVFAIFSDGQRISGDAVDGVYQYQMTVPEFSAQGTWTVQTFLLVDNAGNNQALTATQLANAGFPTSFQQTGS